ncbi:phage holin family protein [Corynebacterium caspium]|uniref:phage holin family protein n=1 Tax=Corynebacterium caspium TaxID=234828 RepID=UPI00037AAA2E|nr:phage holin family protein [Corynebacterium caspium]WKD58570.1 hypothetical protein CCASP_00710 [Corynebacterium caspium DSM 44850]
MSNKDGLFTDSAHNFEAQVNSIPLRDVDASTGEESVGTLVSKATSQISSLVRAEVELAKSEIGAQAKKALVGGGAFGAAGIIALYSSFFFFFFLAELLALWLDRWAAFLIVFALMLVLAVFIAIFGWRKIKKMGAPKRTMESVNELKKLVPGKAEKNLDAATRGMYS